ncbi:hypothetical protein EC844_10670 [Acinetobacter calcoaceticus]|uniref:Uncharacterized protein n=1 Tax=Acinetobacter calcoaceticus TaxID=471 RepID=A0A4V2R1C9_ACICA|nr:hypothetical protein EC844_10670 [Acinetobacter calcoaceticus]
MFSGFVQPTKVNQLSLIKTLLPVSCYSIVISLIAGCDQQFDTGKQLSGFADKFQSNIDQQFLKDFSLSIRPEIEAICKNYSQQNDNPKNNENGIYISRDNHGKHTILGMKDQRFELLIFQKKWDSQVDQVLDVIQLQGQYQVINNQISLGPIKATHQNMLQELQPLMMIENQRSTYLIISLEGVAQSIRTNNTLGDESNFMKKIRCRHDDYIDYRGVEEPAPEYAMLPAPLQAMIGDEPLRLNLLEAVHIHRKSAQDQDNPIVEIEQPSKLALSDLKSLFVAQPECAAITTVEDSKLIDQRYTQEATIAMTSSQQRTCL